jgi:hypothetical protein
VIIPVNYAQANIVFGGVALPTKAEITLGLNKELYSGTPAAAANEVRTAFQAAAIRNLLVTEITIESCMVKYGPNDTGPAGESAGSMAGSSSGLGNPANVALLVKKNTGFGGRTGRGRFYIPGIPESAIAANGTILATAVTAWGTALEAFRTTLISLGLVPTLLHGAGSPVQTPMPITSFTVDATGATQRRRMRR